LGKSRGAWQPLSKLFELSPANAQPKAAVVGEVVQMPRESDSMAALARLARRSQAQTLPARAGNATSKFSEGAGDALPKKEQDSSRQGRSQALLDSTRKMLTPWLGHGKQASTPEPAQRLDHVSDVAQAVSAAQRFDRVPGVSTPDVVISMAPAQSVAASGAAEDEPQLSEDQSRRPGDLARVAGLVATASVRTSMAAASSRASYDARTSMARSTN